MPTFKGIAISNPSTLNNGASSILVKLYHVDGQAIAQDQQLVVSLYERKGLFKANADLAKGCHVTFEAKAVLDADPKDALAATEQRPELAIHRAAGFDPESLSVTRKKYQPLAFVLDKLTENLSKAKKAKTAA